METRTPPPSAGLIQEKCPEPQREKHWDELDADGKIERLHLVVRELIEMGARAQCDAGRAKAIAQSHQHGTDGSVMVPVHNSGVDCNEPTGRGRDSKWF